mmetsp:Transcript_5545/g.12123  ORF Transcript_5545/g.12123 Transcript_5545/m.12123 type:complete len:333 (+) Transcript_5545:55-1053(+)|eukprot:CAMPEP_0172553744 /NCGR_PEP_ID=MMETSP1067-20121228/51525_1 /TAXON_ID=265564 ORGANISM="Thalassiosira punctigera, Strain Tpunct2005C2" /NCGR_SAMPLE_ID=MMETSP1067 /ASSEMBLY_ACC=CAM_ASM_000444 /LENGTH=332 /DNA_ID=CAMNT_0013341967 /DNA_START=69 /DNA_END=1067 /DNA_ORIENTATION=+
MNIQVVAAVAVTYLTFLPVPSSAASAFIAADIARKPMSLTMTTNPTPSSSFDDSESLDEITILGFGSLLSLQSSRLTFPTLRNFRLGRVPDHRRVFAHPASIFFKRNIANLDTLEMSSLSCEYEEGYSFVCSVFEVPNAGLSSVACGDEKTGRWIPSKAFLEREEEFEITMVPYEELTSTDADNGKVPVRVETSMSDDTTSSSMNVDKPMVAKKGVICRRSTDEAYLAQWGQAHWENQYSKYGVKTIWNWERDSGLKPCPVYLRHCVLASWNCENAKNGHWTSEGAGGVCYSSFLDDTYLVDRKTTVRNYLEQYPSVMETEPPVSLRERYSG